MNEPLPVGKMICALTLEGQKRELSKSIFDRTSVGIEAYAILLKECPKLEILREALSTKPLRIDGDREVVHDYGIAREFFSFSTKGNPMVLVLVPEVREVVDGFPKGRTHPDISVFIVYEHVLPADAVCPCELLVRIHPGPGNRHEPSCCKFELRLGLIFGFPINADACVSDIKVHSSSLEDSSAVAGEVFQMPAGKFKALATGFQNKNILTLN